MYLVSKPHILCWLSILYLFLTSKSVWLLPYQNTVDVFTTVTNTGNDQLMKGRLSKILRCRIYLHKFNKELKNVLCRPSLILSTSTPPVWDFFMGMYEYMFYEIYEGITNADFYDDIRVQLGENKDK